MLCHSSLVVISYALYQYISHNCVMYYLKSSYIVDYLMNNLAFVYIHMLKDITEARVHCIVHLHYIKTSSENVEMPPSIYYFKDLLCYSVHISFLWLSTFKEPEVITSYRSFSLSSEWRFCIKLLTERVLKSMLNTYMEF